MPALPEPVAAVAVERSYGRLGRAAVAQMQGIRSSYEDAHLLSQELGMCGVYDGHNGEEAAAFVAARLHRHVVAGGAPGPVALQSAFVACDQEMQRKMPQGCDAGTTATLAVVHDDGHPDKLKIWVANCGDARAVLWHRGADSIEETRDHRPSDDRERARIEAAGGYVFDEWEPPRVDGELACSRALGDFRFKRDANLPPGNQKVSAVPDIYEWHATRGDWLIVACDGIWDTFSTKVVVDHVCKKNANAELGSKLAMFLNFCIEKNADDNLTLAAVELGVAPRATLPVLSLMPFGYLKATDDEVIEQYDAFCRRFGRALEKKTRSSKKVTSLVPVPPSRHAAAFALHLASPPAPQSSIRLPLQVPLEDARSARTMTLGEREMGVVASDGGLAGTSCLSWCGGRQPDPHDVETAAGFDKEVTEPLHVEALRDELPRITPRSFGVDESFSDHGEWDCPSCTFLNAGTDAECAMCGKPRPRPSGGGVADSPSVGSSAQARDLARKAPAPSGPPVDASDFPEGARVEAEFEGSWYPGTVVKVPARPGGDFAVQCDQDPDGCLTYTNLLRPGAAAAESGEVVEGSRVEAFYDGEWIPGTVVTVAKGRFDDWVVQCDGDAQGQLTYTDEVRPLH